MDISNSNVYKIVNPSKTNLDNYVKPIFKNQEYAEERLQFLAYFAQNYGLKDDQLMQVSIKRHHLIYAQK